MSNVIRQDVVELSFDIGNSLKEIKKLQNDINELKKKLTGDIDNGAFDDLKDDVEKTRKPFKKLTEEAEKVRKKVAEIGKTAATTAFNGLKKLAGISFKATIAGIGAAATAIGGLVAKSVSAYAEFEQLKGGVETLFGAKGAQSVEEYAKIMGKTVGEVEKDYKKLKGVESTVIGYANDAFKTAGLSANDYMNTVTSFSASLISSVGGDTKKAADLANMAIVDMSDNANKMGTDMGSLQYAYQGFAKQNYTMLDNLKLGYGGTKTEMERLIKDAAKMKDVQKKLGIQVDANSMSYGNIVKAIHVVQEQMYINGTTQKEAEGTITGSLSMVKAAWGNLMPALIQGGDTFDKCVENLIYSVDKFAGNIMPAIEKALAGAGTLIEKLAPKLAEIFPDLAKKLIPPLIKAAVELTKGLIKALPTIIKTLAVTIVDIFGEQFPIIRKIGDFFSENAGTIANSIKKIIPVVIALAAAFKGFKMVSGITAIFGKLKGSGGGSGKDSGGIFGGITNTFKGLANTKPTVILKGMANLGIILGGFALLSAGLMAVAPYMAKLSDGKSLLEVVSVIAVLGLVGTGLAKFGQIAGKIPVSTVAKGLANMAIMLGGMSALFLLVGAVSLIDFDIKKILQITAVIAALGTVGTILSVFAGIVGLIPVAVVALGLANMAIIIAGMSALFLLIGATSLLNFDYKKILQIVDIIGILGTVGSILSVFAGIVGMIPIPIVLAGLANMGLVLGGMTALIVAFGKLTQVQGFTEFLEKGGQVLVQIMNILGEMVGALAGGLIEGLSSCLPALGENLGKFGENIKPLFTSIAGVDMAGVGAFFTSLVGLLGIATGNEIVEGIKSFFGGEQESSLSKLGTELGNFATNSKGFFDQVATFPENGFTNATKLFECLAGMKSLPKEGGIVGWFTGGINYENLASGLGHLSGEKVKGFFAVMAELKQAGFDNATKLFDCLAGMKSLPKDGGVAGWFTGNINYENIATGLGHLAGEKVKSFFTMVGELNEKTFTNITALFDSLGSIKELPKEGGWWDSITGTETSTLANVATELGTFGEKTKAFFEQVNSLNVGNLNALWDSLQSAGKLTTDNLSGVIGESISTLVSKISELPKKMGDALKSNSQGLSDGFVSMWQAAVKASVAPVNKLLEGANHILKEFGSSKKVISWQPYAKGTDGHKGGNAVVNDGRGAELVQMPNGHTFIPKGRNVFLPNAPKGMKVLNASKTARLMGRTSPTFRYADGVGEFDVWSFYDNAQGLIDAVSQKYVSYDGMKGLALNMGQAMVNTFKGEMTNWAKKLFEETGGMSIESYIPSKGVNQWRPAVIRALKMEGQYSEANVKRTLYQMQTESGGNPRAINLWDSNAKKGIPSKGLMQVIDPTFKAYARAGFDKNIYDPLSNILASIRYAVSRYGSLEKAYRGVGYSSGVGTVTLPSQPAVSMKYTPDNSYSGGRAEITENNTYSPVFNLTINGSDNEREIKRKIKRWVSEAFEEVVDSMNRKNPRLREV